MSFRTNIFMTSGVMVMIIVLIAYVSFTLSKINDQIEALQLYMEQGRDIGNFRGNATLGATGELISDLKQTEINILGNLTDHRLVANATRDATFDLLNRTLTSEKYGSLADQRVNNIIGNLSSDHEIIMKALNISKTDNVTDAEVIDEQLLTKILRQLENRTN